MGRNDTINNNGDKTTYEFEALETALLSKAEANTALISSNVSTITANASDIENSLNSATITGNVIKLVKNNLWEGAPSESFLRGLRQKGEAESSSEEEGLARRRGWRERARRGCGGAGARGFGVSRALVGRVML